MGPHGPDAFAERDAELIARLRQDDVRALGVLMQTYAERLTQIARLVVRRTDLAQDVVQNVFVSLWHRRAELEISGSVFVYLGRAVRNQAISTIRHEQAQQRAHDAVEAMYAIGPRVAWNEGAAALEVREIDQRIRHAIDTLQPQVREIFLLRRLHGMAYPDIAALLGVSVLTVRSQMSRAIRRLIDVVREG